MDSPTHLTIRAIRARGLNLTLERPIQTASGVMNTTPLVLVDLLTQEGITGHSYVRCPQMHSSHWSSSSPILRGCS